MAEGHHVLWIIADHGHRRRAFDYRESAAEALTDHSAAVPGSTGLWRNAQQRQTSQESRAIANTAVSRDLEAPETTNRTCYAASTRP
ncbi:hypothetical protein ABIB26_002360 [Arthrobacter sp. UYEF20]